MTNQKCCRASTFAILACLALASCQTAQRASKSDLASDIATEVVGRPFLISYNVENAYDGIEQGTEHEGYTPSTSNWGETAAISKAKRVARVLTEANCPLVVVLAEVENQLMADMIARAAGECGYAAISANADQSLSNGVAILTALRLSDVALIPSGYRPHLRVTLPDRTIVYAVHLKSMRDDNPALRQQMLDALTADMRLFGNTRVIAAGDFNTVGDVLPNSEWQWCTQSSGGTSKYQGRWQALDKIYSNQCGRAQVMQPEFLMRNGQPFRSVWCEQAGKTCHENIGYSDHLPLIMWE